jgi:hypothetical protein
MEAPVLCVAVVGCGPPRGEEALEDLREHVDTRLVVDEVATDYQIPLPPPQMLASPLAAAPLLTP